MAEEKQPEVPPTPTPDPPPDPLWLVLLKMPVVLVRGWFSGVKPQR